MRWLLAPVTFILWFLLTYLCLYYGMYLLMWVFNLNWLLLIIFYTVIVGIVSFLVISLPNLINHFVLRFYRYNWFSIIIHSMAGILAFGYFYYLIYYNPPAVTDGNNSEFLLSGLWNISWVKTIMLVPIYLGLHFGLLILSIINPYLIKGSLVRNNN